jgi:hypothetical protein
MPEEFSNFYRLVKEGLSSAEERVQIGAAEVVLDVAKFATPAQNYMLFRKQYIIF